MVKLRFGEVVHRNDQKGKTLKHQSNCIRMMQAHAGPGYGMHLPLKPGTEVLVAFEGGDPDRPFIAGSVPDGVNKSPSTATNATSHIIRSVGGIEILMDDPIIPAAATSAPHSE